MQRIEQSIDRCAISGELCRISNLLAKKLGEFDKSRGC